MKQLLINKDIKKLFLSLCTLFLVFLLCGQLLSVYMTHHYKNSFYKRDVALAGALLNSGFPPEKTAALFTQPTSKSTHTSGQELLKQAGYSPAIKNNLFPSFSSFQRNSSFLLLSYGLFFVLCVFFFFVFHFRAQQKTIDQAVLSLKQFIDGSTSVRIDSNFEGSLYRLFTLINALATSLTAHLQSEKKAKDFLKTTMSDISHQLKTPLSALKMYNEILQEDGLDPAVLAKFTSKSESSINRMEILIQNLLKITRLDAGAISMTFSDQKIHELMNTIAVSFETRAKQENKSILLNGDNTSTLYCDPEWMIEAISNIIKNALDHTSTQDVITINWGTTPTAATLSIHDNGSGIPPEDIHHIFKRFYRSRFSQDSQGSGLGLSLAKTITTAHYGTIYVTSNPKTGTLFTLTF